MLRRKLKEITTWKSLFKVWHFNCTKIINSILANALKLLQACTKPSIYLVQFLTVMFGHESTSNQDQFISAGTNRRENYATRKKYWGFVRIYWKFIVALYLTSWLNQNDSRMNRHSAVEAFPYKIHFCLVISHFTSILDQISACIFTWPWINHARAWPGISSED